MNIFVFQKKNLVEILIILSNQIQKDVFYQKKIALLKVTNFLIIYAIYLHVLLIQKITIVIVFVLALIFFIKICPQTYMFALIKMKNVLQKDIILK